MSSKSQFNALQYYFKIVLPILQYIYMNKQTKPYSRNAEKWKYIRART